MLELLPVKSILTSSGVRLLLRAFSFRPDDPQLIKKRYFVDIVDALARRYPPPPASEAGDRTKFSTITEGKLRGHARWYVFRAQMLWGQPSLRDRYKSAWLYVTAAHLSEQAGDRKAASDLYHFGANALREVEAYRASIDYYVKAGSLGTDAWVRRCYQRALGVAHTAGDDSELARVQKLLHALPAPKIDG